MRVNRITKFAALLLTAALAAAVARGASPLGGLYVTTEPLEAGIYVNGELKGVSPCGIPDVGQGNVEVAAVKQGFAPAKQTVEVKGGRTIEVHLALTRLAQVGSIAVTVEPPGARVEIDRIPAGRTPCVVLNVRTGTHRVVVSEEGYRPMQTTATVAAGEQYVLRGRLEPIDRQASQDTPPVDLENLGKLDPADVPGVEYLPEEIAFEPVRNLIADRRYDDALRALEEMPDEDKTRYALRAARERGIIHRIRRAVETAHDQLRKSKGKECVLPLRIGFRLTGTLVDVTDTEVVINASGTDRAISLGRISADELVRLASQELDPGEPANREAFALLYAAEEEFEKAYEQLRAAAGQGYDITAGLSYVDAEHLWAAAVEKDGGAALTRSGDRRRSPKLSGTQGPVRVLLDGHRGEAPANPGTFLPADRFAVKQLTGPFEAAHAESADVLVVLDGGPGRPVAPYDRQEVQRIMDFIHNGGGLVFIGSSRPADDADPFEPLLRWCSILVRPDRLLVAQGAPQAYPRQYALAYPVYGSRHLVASGVRSVVFPISSPSLRVFGRSWALLRASRYVASESTRKVSPILAAGGAYGQGRFVVFAAMPLLNKSSFSGSPFSVNDADAMLRNSVLWAAGATAQ